MPNGSLQFKRSRSFLAKVGVTSIASLAVISGTMLIALAADRQPQAVRKAAKRNAVANPAAFARSRAKQAWSPEQVEGPPNVPAAGDNPAAWASLGQDDQPEWLICEYRSAVNARSVSVYESLAPGALVKLTAFNPEGKEVVAWEGKDPTPRTAQRGVSLIPIRLPFQVQKIKLYLDSPAVPNWNEIDAVGLEDTEGVTHWTERARASSTYGSAVGGNPNAPYSTRQAVGEPDTFNPGDRPTAWASATPDDQEEWLALEFEKAEKPVEIVVHENTSPGAITRISVINPAGEEVTAWEGVDPTPPSEPWGVSVFPVKLDFPVKKIKLHIDSVGVGGYNEIDAVALRSANRTVQWAKDASASSTFGMPVQNMAVMEMPANPLLRELAAELKRVKEQVDELKKGKDELEKRVQKLSDTVK